MDELQMLDKLQIKPEPSPDLINRGRQQLRLAMHEPTHRRPTRLQVGGSIGLAAAAVAVVISSNPTPPAQQAAASPGSQRVVTPLSGRQILLAAAKLTAWIVKARSNLHPSDRDGAIDSDLTSLLSDVPVPPSVRAAAFRALAARPNVKDLGPVTGGQALQIPILGGTKKVVVDPATSIVHSEGYVAGSGKKTFTKGVITVLKAGWTNTLPKTPTPHK